MVRWVNAQQVNSPIAGAITQAANSLWGDTLTPALKKEQLLKAQRENAGAANMQDLFRTAGNAAAGYQRPPRGAAAPPRGPVFTGTQNPAGLPSSIIDAVDRVDPSGSPMARGIADTAGALGVTPQDMATLISYETGGTMNPMQPGPVTKWGQHRGLIQAGEPQAQTYGIDFSSPEAAMASQLGPDGAIVKYARAHGFEPGMSALDLYSSINAGAPGRYGASDAHNGGAPGTVADKFYGQMDGHRARAEAMFGAPMPPADASPLTGAPAGPGEYNPLNAGQFYGEAAARAIEAGMAPQQAADLARMFMAGSYGAENQATTDAVVGAGGNYASTYSGFAADQNRQERDSLRGDMTDQRGQDIDYSLGLRRDQTDQRGQDIGYSLGIYEDQNETVDVLRNGVPTKILKRDLQPTDQVILSDAETKAQAVAGMDLSREERLAYVGAEPKNVQQADTYVDGNGSAFRSVDGITDATTGELLPPDAIKTGVQGASRSDAGLDKINARNAEAQVLSGQMFKGTLGRARDAAIATGPTGFGVAGRLRSAGQDARAAFDSLSQTMGGDFAANISQTEGRLRDMAEKGDTVAQGFFSDVYDPTLTEIELYARLLPYEAAAAIAGQEGRGLSDYDVKRFQQIVGDPLSFLGSQRAFLTTIDTLEREVDARIRGNSAFLESGRGAVPADPPRADAPATPPQVQSDDEYNALPSGTEYVAPDGSLRRKQ